MGSRAGRDERPARVRWMGKARRGRRDGSGGLCHNAGGRIMAGSREHSILEIMGGQTRGAGAALARTGLSLIEPFYAGVMGARNLAYEHGFLRVTPLPRPTISVGNITTGGTGKTPMVRWVAEALRAAGRRPAVLMRGYRRGGAAQSDEQVMLNEWLNRDGAAVHVPVHANADRVAGAAEVVREHPELDVFVLDDGFQHRRAGRDLDIVLVNAREPFGFGHVLPRGLLREPMSGLRRAGAFVITHAGEVSPQTISGIEAAIRKHSPAAPIYRADHSAVGFRCGNDGLAAELTALEGLRDRRYFAFCGIGSPQSFEGHLVKLGGVPVGRRRFDDHHDYTRADVAELGREAQSAGADVLVTTAKDWAKLGAIVKNGAPVPPVWRLEIAIRFADGDEGKLTRQIHGAIEGR